MMKPLAITGVGVVSSLGTGWQRFREGVLKKPAPCETALTVLDPEKYPDVVPSEVQGFDPAKELGAKGWRTFDRLTKFCVSAAKQALYDAGVKREQTFVDFASEEIGVCTATAYGSLDAIAEMGDIAYREDPRYVNPAKFPNTVVNTPSGYVSIWEELHGPNIMLVDGNCGSLDVFLNASIHLSAGRANAFVVGGGEVLSEPLAIGLRQLGVLAPRGEHFEPGSPMSQGTRMGEGAAYVALERYTDAVRRGANVLAVVHGYGAAFVAPMNDNQLSAISSDAVVTAIESALADAGWDTSDVEALATSMSGVVDHDNAEREGLGRVFPGLASGGGPVLWMPKALLGETFGASGIFALLYALSCGGSVSRVVLVATGYYGNVSALAVQIGSTTEVKA